MENINTLTDKELAGLEDVHSTYHADHTIADKNIDPKSPNFGKKGKSHFIKDSQGGEGQWYIQYKDDEDVTRVKWWQLDSNVGEGSYGEARYKGINRSIFDKIGELSYTNRKWIFIFDGEKYTLNNPESVVIL